MSSEASSEASAKVIDAWGRQQVDPVTRVLSVLVVTMNRVDEMQVEAVAQTVSFVLVGLLATRVWLLSVSRRLSSASVSSLVCHLSCLSRPFVSSRLPPLGRLFLSVPFGPRWSPFASMLPHFLARPRALLSVWSWMVSISLLLPPVALYPRSNPVVLACLLPLIPRLPTPCA